MVVAEALPELPEALFFGLHLQLAVYSMDTKTLQLHRILSGSMTAPDYVALACGTACMLQQFPTAHIQASSHSCLSPWPSKQWSS